MPGFWNSLVRKKNAMLRRLARRLQQDDERRQMAAEVQRELSGLLANPGVRPLARAERARIRDYGLDRFRDPVFVPLLEFYATYRGGFVEGWIPENYFQTIGVRRLNGRYHDLSQARTLQARLLRSPAMPDILRRVGGEWRDAADEPVERARVPALAFADGDTVYLKREQSFQGRGVTRETHASFDLDRVETLGNFVVQKAIRQAAFFDAIHSGAVATLRITTGKLEGARPWNLGAYLRVGAGSDEIIGAGALKTPVLDGAGALGAFASDKTWRRHDRHPDTGFRFEGAVIPGFPEAVALCLDLHADRMPQFGIIGWDVAIDDAGAAWIMEFNTGYPGIKFIEASLGPALVPFHLERFAGDRPAPLNYKW